jgi:hypothetical protein
VCLGHQQGDPDEHQRYADYDHLASAGNATPPGRPAS